MPNVLSVKLLKAKENIYARANAFPEVGVTETAAVAAAAAAAAEAVLA